MKRFFAGALLLGVVFVTNIAAGAAPPLPTLDWEECADWINVRSEVTPKAVGDGQADDTAALQAALDQMHGLGGGPKVVYLPPGEYRITQTLVMPNSVGCVMLGHGRATTIRWDGPASEEGGAMLWSNGSVCSRYEGIIWDGAGKARVGVHHFARDRFENKILHQHEAFLNFTAAGVLMGRQNPFASSESELRNCWFERCAAGLSIIDFNYYNEVVEGCEFRDCGIGVHCTRWGQIYARDCHFERSAVADFSLGESHKHSVRRCTSVDSHQFLVGREVTLQDCHVEGWRSEEGAIALTLGSPVMMFDCVFTRPPSSNPPVRVANAKQKLIVSNNVSSQTDGMIGGAIDLIEIPPGSVGGAIRSARQTFFKSQARAPGKVFDAVRDFGADPKQDATAAVQAAIDAARAHGQGAIAYLPAGRYRISRTLDVTGADYFVGGVGYHSELQWAGEPGGVLMHVHDAQRVTLRDLNLIGHSTPREMTGIRQTGGGAPSYVVYDRIWTPDGWQSDDQTRVRGVEFVGLTGHDRVEIARLNGGGAVMDSAAAQFLARFWDGGPIVVQGKPADSPGFCGVLAGNGNQIVVRDNCDLVIGDYYCEQAKGTILSASGNRQPRAGRLTLGAARLHAWKEATSFAEIDNYAGLLSYTHGHITRDQSAESYLVRQTGDQPLDLVFAAHSHPFFSFQTSPTTRRIFMQNNGLENVLPEQNQEVLSRVLDHFRELGRKDVEFLGAN